MRNFWIYFKRPKIKALTKEEVEREVRQAHRLSETVVWAILSQVGEPVLREVLAALETNRKETCEANYTSLAEIWVAAKKRYEEVEKKCH